MLSRVADRIYWMSRQMERAESMARVLGVTSNLVLFGSPELQRQNLLAPLIITGGAEAFFERHSELSVEALIDFLALDRDNPSSIVCCLSTSRITSRWRPSTRCIARAARVDASSPSARLSCALWNTLPHISARSSPVMASPTNASARRLGCAQSMRSCPARTSRALVTTNYCAHSQRNRRSAASIGHSIQMVTARTNSAIPF